MASFEASVFKSEADPAQDLLEVLGTHRDTYERAQKHFGLAIQTLAQRLRQLEGEEVSVSGYARHGLVRKELTGDQMCQQPVSDSLRWRSVLVGNPETNEEGILLNGSYVVCGVNEGGTLVHLAVAGNEDVMQYEVYISTLQHAQPNQPITHEDH